MGTYGTSKVEASHSMHLSSEEALDLTEGKVTEAQTEFWTAHLRICAECNNQLNSWKQMRSILGATHLESAPEEVIRIAEAIHSPSDKPSKVRQILASLLFDSFAQPALAGSRGTSGARQFLFNAEGFDIH